MKRILLAVFAMVLFVACSGDLSTETVGKTEQAAVSGAFVHPAMLSTTFSNIRSRDYIANCMCVADTAIWQNEVAVSDGATAGGASLAKTGSDGWGNAGASTTVGFAGDGYFEFSTSESTKRKMAGLSVGDADQQYWDIDHALYLDDAGALYVFESGTNRGAVGSYVANDVFRVQRVGTTVRYYKYTSGALALLYTSGVSSSGTLLLDTSLYSNGATLRKVNTESTQYFLFLGSNSAGNTWEWHYDTGAHGGAYPLARVSAAAYDIFLAGTFNSSTSVITYGGNTYRMRLVRDTNGVQVAEAYLF